MGLWKPADTDAKPVKGLRHLRIDRSIPCESCRYELKGLQIEGQCPECGMPILKSVECFRPDGGGMLERLCHGIRLNGNSWLVTGFLSLGCFGATIGLIQPMALFLAFAAAGRALSIVSLIFKNRAAVPTGLPIGSWGNLLVILPGLEVFISLIVAVGLPSRLFQFDIIGESVMLASLAGLTAFEGLAWTGFIKRFGRELECAHTDTAVSVIQIAWLLMLLATLLALMMWIIAGIAGGPIPGILACWVLPGLLAWYLAVFMTGVVTKAFGDALARMDRQRTVDFLEELLEPPEPSAAVEPAAEGNHSPLPLADSSETRIEIRESDSVSPPPDPPEEKRYRSDGEEDVY